MRTPAGTECCFYYADFHRGRSIQACRLIERNPRSEPWRPALCKNCPVPGILQANACPNMVLEGRVARRLLGLQGRVEVYAICTERHVEVRNPYVGCGYCHPEAAALLGASDEVTGEAVANAEHG